MYQQAEVLKDFLMTNPFLYLQIMSMTETSIHLSRGWAASQPHLSSMVPYVPFFLQCAILLGYVFGLYFTGKFNIPSGRRYAFCSFLMAVAYSLALFFEMQGCGYLVRNNI